MDDLGEEHRRQKVWDGGKTTRGLGDGSPPAGSRGRGGRGAGGRSAPEAEEFLKYLQANFTNFW